MKLEAEAQLFLLVFIRITTFIVICPAFSMKSVPAMMKIALSMGLTMAVFTALPPLEANLSNWTFIGWIVKEMLVGFSFGYITQLYFTAIEMAGKLVDFQVGFSMGEVYDPSLGVSVSYYGRIYYWISICLFFMTNLHHQLLRGLVQSYQLVPVSQTSFGQFGTEGMVNLFGEVFGIALQLAVPLMIVALLSEVVLSLLSRTVPQINVLVLGMPLKVIVSLVFFLLFLRPLIQNIGNILPEMIKYTNEWLRSLSS